MAKIVKVKKCHIYYDGMQLFSANIDCGIYFFIRAVGDVTETVFVGVPANKTQYQQALTKQLDISTLFSNPSGEYLVIKTNNELSESFHAEISNEIPVYDFMPAQGLFIEEPAFPPDEYAFENFYSFFSTDYFGKQVSPVFPTWAKTVPLLPENNILCHTTNPIFYRREFSWTTEKNAPSEVLRTSFTKEATNEDLQLAA